MVVFPVLNRELRNGNAWGRGGKYNDTTDENTRLCSFDIDNMYTKIPTMELKSIIKDILNNEPHITKEEREELVHLVSTTLQTLQQQNEGLPRPRS
jgi:hypothetical protein